MSSLEERLADPTQVVRDAWSAGLRPDPILSVSEWADRHRFLSSKDSAEPGKWDTARAPYEREIMDALSPESPYWRVVFMKGAQIGATQIGNNWIGHTIDVAPAPMLMVLPSTVVARKISKQRIAPMIAVTPRLAAKVSSSRARDSGNTTFEKDFEGGILMLAGANSPSGLRSMPIKNLMLDEADGFPPSAGAEGDPVGLAEARTSTFESTRKIYICSTPTVDGLSRIAAAFKETDQRRYFIPCPACGHKDWLQWREGGYYGEGDNHHFIYFENHDPSTARMRCSRCRVLVEEHHKTWMLANGEWRPTATAKEPGIVGFHLSTLYAPLGWESWPKIVAQFEAAKRDPFRLRLWVNTRLGETWKEVGAEVNPDSIMGRRKQYPAEVPNGVGILVAGVDVQGDRIEPLVFGYGAGEESWIIAHEQIWGDTSQEAVWLELGRFLLTRFRHESGRRMRIETTAIDTNFETDRAYRFCAVRRAQRVFAVRGSSEHGKEIVSKPTFGNSYRLPLFTVGGDTCKEILYGRLRIPEPGPGYVHFPHWVEKEFADQMTAEMAIPKYIKGKGTIRVWVKKRDRNEILDCSVYALAALHIGREKLIARLGARAELFARKVTKPPPADEPDAPVADGPPEPPPAPKPPVAPAPRPRRRGGWVNDWRRR